MGKESETKQVTNTNSTQQNKIPKWLTSASKSIAGRAEDLASTPYEAYTGDRVAGFNADEESAFQHIRNLVANSPDVIDESLAGARGFAYAPAQHVSTERVVDENGQLGAIADYMNPYLDNALQPALQRIYEAADRARLQNNRMATMSGAFGDARHGVEGGVLNRDTMRATGDTASQFYKDAFDRVMGLRTSDLNRFLDVDKTNAGYNEVALQRLFGGTDALIDRASQDQARQLQQFATLLGAGNQQRQVAQAGLDADYQEFLRKMGWDKDMLLAASSAIRGLPHDSTSTTQGTTTSTTTQPDNSLFQLAGTLAGAALGGPMGASIGGSLFGGSSPTPLALGGSSVGPTGAAAPYAGNPYGLPWLA